MFLQIPDLMTPAEVAELRAIAASAAFIDGRASNPHSKVKNNEIIGDADAHARSSRIMLAALGRSEAFKDFAMPRTVASPMLTRYGADRHYGLHADAAFMPMKDRPLRADLSVVRSFLSDPATYEGGALRVMLGDRAVEFRPEAGAAVVYPSTTLHEVVPVARGDTAGGADVHREQDCRRVAARGVVRAERGGGAGGAGDGPCEFHARAAGAAGVAADVDGALRAAAAAG